MNFYYNKWCPRFFYKKYDGGKESGVVGYFLIEWKKLFSIGLLRFSEGSRENYHSHAFNAITWWLSGQVTEIEYTPGLFKRNRAYIPSLIPKITLKNKVHKVISHKTTWALTFRGPWEDTWHEVNRHGKVIKLTHGRKIINEYDKDT